MNVKTIKGHFLNNSAKVIIVAGQFNSFIVDSLVKGALDTLLRNGIKEKDITVVQAPGAFEIPLVVKRCAQELKPDAILALGAVIRGGTPHFEYVAGSCTKGISQLSLEFDIPIAFGVLTVDSIEQAIERAGTKAGNKGAEAALSTLETLSVLNQLGVE